MKLFIGNISPDEVILRDEEAHHIVKVLRMTSGEEIFITDGKGSLVKGRIIISGKKVSIDIIEKIQQKEKPKNNLHIAIAPTKSMDRFDFFIEKSIELGITEITPILCTNSERKILKIDKIEKQVESACKQSLKVHFPKINPFVTLKDFIQQQKQQLYVAHCYQEYNKIPLKEVLVNVSDLVVLIGPEGDFSKKEIEELYQNKAIGIDLGNSRLRTETAGIFISAAYYYLQTS